ncbi:MAG: relaxase/mobilization nuclease domain-containing protein [Bacteroides cellulosilyticus]|nr:relaxase/mobilization nuclease domain-containing protein [Bacteroides cellulosilyticus]
MVANIRSGATVGGALYYNEEKVDRGEADVLLTQRMLPPITNDGRLDMEACMESFMPYLRANRRTTNTVFHTSLNPALEDQLSDEQLREIAAEYMERMGYGAQPYIVFKHQDIEREHLHIVSLRIDADGRKLPHDFEARRSMDILRDLEQKYGLHPAVPEQEQDTTSELRKVDYKTGDIKRQIQSSVRACLKRYRCASFGELRTLLELYNIQIMEMTGTIDGRDYAGIVYGTMGEDGYGRGKPIKASRMGKDVGYEALQWYYTQSKELLREDGALDDLRSKVRNTVLTSWSKESFCRHLRKKGVDAVFRANAMGRIYGVTFVDHHNGIVANGSMLGKHCAANMFNLLYGRSQDLAIQPSPCPEARTWQEHYPSSHPARAMQELFDMQAYEEMQQQEKQRRKRRRKKRLK